MSSPYTEDANKKEEDDFLENYLEQQNVRTKRETQAYILSEREYEVLRRAWWMFMFVVIGVIAFIALIITGAFATAKKTYPKLFCFFETQKLMNSTDPQCTGIKQYSPYQLAIAYMYPAMFDMLNRLYVFPDITQGEGQFLFLLINNFSDKITSLVWNGGGEKFLETCLGEFKNPFKKSIDEGCKDEAHVENVCENTKCIDAFWNVWKNSCTKGNPFVCFFPNDAKQFLKVKCVCDEVDQLRNYSTYSDPSSEFSMARLFSQGMSAIASDCAGMNGAQMYTKMFHADPNWIDTAGMQKDDCDAQWDQGGWQAAAAGLGGGMGAFGIAKSGLTASKGSPGLSKSGAGWAGALAGLAGLGIGIGVSLWNTSKQIDGCKSWYASDAARAPPSTDPAKDCGGPTGVDQCFKTLIKEKPDILKKLKDCKEM